MLDVKALGVTPFLSVPQMSKASKADKPLLS